MFADIYINCKGGDIFRLWKSQMFWEANKYASKNDIILIYFFFVWKYWYWYPDIRKSEISQVTAILCRRNWKENIQGISPDGNHKKMKEFYSLKIGCLHLVACTRSDSGFLSNATLFYLEQFHIFSLWKENLHLNDIYTDIHNPIFNTIINHYK
jgi:hypothetical protein